MVQVKYTLNGESKTVGVLPFYFKTYSEKDVIRFYCPFEVSTNNHFLKTKDGFEIGLYSVTEGSRSENPVDTIKVQVF